MNTTLRYTFPAKSFTQALPLGNGSLGAMVYGGVPEEKISLNLDTFWSGTGHKKEKEIETVQGKKLRFPMPSALCSYCLGETRIGEKYQMGNVRKMNLGGANE